ncbi:hypothetical protein DRP04_14950 [Archaeoglobales archaeon]|nr:MAG: hypothetical protein DRP04_14950 [Archaeoglobales archaeon]
MASELKRQIIDLLEKDKEFRYTVSGLIGLREILDELRELRKKSEEHDRKFNEILERLREHDEKFGEVLTRAGEHDKKFNEIVARLEEHDRKFNEILERLDRHKRILEEHSKRIEELSTAIKGLREDFNIGMSSFQRVLDALGSRWGLLAESAFREGMRGIVEEYFKGKVERWIYDDKEGFVFGYPSIVDVDLIVKDGVHVLVEVKSSISRSDIAVLVRKGKLYERVRGIKPKLAVVSPYVDENAAKDAEKLGIAIYTS